MHTYCFNLSDSVSRNITVISFCQLKSQDIFLHLVYERLQPDSLLSLSSSMSWSLVFSPLLVLFNLLVTFMFLSSSWSLCPVSSYISVSNYAALSKSSRETETQFGLCLSNCGTMRCECVSDQSHWTLAFTLYFSHISTLKLIKWRYFILYIKKQTIH